MAWPEGLVPRVAWLDCTAIAGKGDFTDIMYKVVLELAIVKVKNLVLF